MFKGRLIGDCINCGENSSMPLFSKCISKLGFSSRHTLYEHDMCLFILGFESGASRGGPSA